MSLVSHCNQPTELVTALRQRCWRSKMTYFKPLAAARQSSLWYWTFPQHLIPSTMRSYWGGCHLVYMEVLSAGYHLILPTEATVRTSMVNFLMLLPWDMVCHRVPLVGRGCLRNKQPVGDIIRQHGLSFHIYTDLYNLRSESHWGRRCCMFKLIRSAPEEVKSRMTKNKLKLNDSKTRVLHSYQQAGCFKTH